jgi:hypothetical protein
MTPASARVLRLLHLSARYLRCLKPRASVVVEIGGRIWLVL